LIDKLAVLDRKFDGLVWADADAASAAPAGLTDGGPTGYHVDGVDKAHSLRTDPAAYASLTHCHLDAWHAAYFVADVRRKVGQGAPQAAARAAVTDCEQLVTRTDAQPDRVQLVAADQVH
jgi:hypothetical protein